MHRLLSALAPLLARIPRGGGIAEIAGYSRQLCFAVVCMMGVLPNANAAFDISLSANGGTVSDVGQWKTVTVAYSWSSLVQDLANAQIVVDVPAALAGGGSDVTVTGSAHTTAASYDSGTRKITYTFVNPLPAGSSGSVQFAVYFPNGTSDATLATLTGTSNGTGQSNGTSSVTLEANVPPPVTDIRLTMGASFNPMLGQDLNWTVWLENWGTTSLNSPMVVETLPAGTVYVSSSPAGTYNAGANTVTWNPGTLNAGASVSLYVTVRYDSPTFSVGQTVTHSATANGTDSLGAAVNKSASNTAQIVAANPSGAIDKFDSADPASLKGEFVYYFRVANYGNVTLTNYTVEDSFPVEFIPETLYPGSDEWGGNSSTIAAYFKTNLNATWRTVPGSPFTNASHADPSVPVSTLGLVANEVVTDVRYVYSSVPVGFNGDWRARVAGTIGDRTNGNDRTGAAITPLPKTISNTLQVAYDYSGTTYTGTDTETTQIIGPSPMPYLKIHNASPLTNLPLQEIIWHLEMVNEWGASEALINPVYATLLPANLQYVSGSAITTAGQLPTPAVTVTDNYNGTGRQLVKFAFTGNHPPAYSEVSGAWEEWRQYLDFRTTVKAGSAVGSFNLYYHLIGWGNTLINDLQAQNLQTDTNDIDADANTTEQFNTSNGGDYTVGSSTAIDSVLWVKGEYDAAFNKFPDAGFGRAGSSFTYKLIVTNPGNNSLTGIRVMDILPYVGDVGVVLFNQSRGSAFSPALTSTVTAPAGITVKYSTSSNPDRTDLDASLGNPAGAVSGTFSTTVPGTLSTVKSLLFDFGATVLAPGDSKEITWTMTIPAGVTKGQVAWNSFGHRSQSVTTGNALTPSEPVKVGIGVPISVGSFVWSDTNDNGIQNVGEPGISGVTVAIFKSDGSPALDPLGNTVASTTTDSSGLYTFAGLADGDYFIRITPPTPLLPSSVQVADPDNNIDTDSNIDTTRTPPAGSWESGIFTFTRGTEPVGETGAGGTLDDVDDNNGNMTIDFGFKNCTTITLAALGTNIVGTAYSSSATATGGVGPYNYTVSLGALPAWAALNPSTGAITGTSNSTTTASFTIKATDANGCAGTRAYTLTPSCPLLIMSPAPGPLAQGTVGSAYSQAMSSSGSTGTLSWSVASGTLPAGLGVNSTTGAVAGTPTAPTTGVNGASFSVRAQDQYGCGITQSYSLKVCPTLTFPASMPAPIILVNYNTLPGSAATASGGTGPYNYSLSSAPAWMSINATTGQISGTTSSVGSVSFTVNATDAYGCTGTKSYTVSTVSLSLGNLVWLDTNNNGTKDAAESGLAGATVQLFSPGADNAIGGVGLNADAQVGSNIVTVAGGAYVFSGLAPGKYFVKVTPPAGYIPGGTPATTDNNVDNNNDGSQPSGIGTPIYSPVIDLSVLGESILDGDVDANTNMTVDFGLWPGITVGNLVWADTNNNGTKDGGESGISGLTVELMTGVGNTVITSTTTNAGGIYGFTVYTPGNYRVRVTPNATFPLASTSHSTTDDGVNHVNDGDQPGNKSAPSTSMVFTLTAGGEPGSGGSTNTEDTIDFGFRGCPTITLSPTTLAGGNVGAPYSSGTTASGAAAPYTYAITSGALPSGLSFNAATGAITGTTSVSGNHVITITVTDALGCSVSQAVTIPISATPTYDWSDYANFSPASSFAMTSLRFGATVDADASNPANANASGDDISGSDDEDGIFEPINLVAAVAGSTAIKVTNTTGAVAYLNAWIDFNRNGSLLDAGEQVATNVPIATGTNDVPQTISFTTPATASVGFSAIRLRLTAAASPGPTGAVSSGEVEDYPVSICPTLGFAYGVQSGDLYQIDVATGTVSMAATLPAGYERSNGAAYAQDLGADGVILYSTGTSSLKLGAWDRSTGVTNTCGDLSAFGLPSGNPIHSGDYFNGWYYFVPSSTDDLWKAKITGTSGAYTITSASKVSDLWNNTRSHGYGDIVITPSGIMYAHCTRNGGGPEFYMADLNQATPTATQLGSPAYMHNGITFGLDGKLYGGLGVNNNNADWFEVSLLNGSSTYLRDGVVSGMSDMTMGACNPSPYLINNDPWANKDYGDYSLFTGAQSTLNTNIRLGALVDGESTIANNITASWDDLRGVDDEDGVTFPSQLVQGQTGTITINRVNTSGANAYLNAWMDFNNDGILTDAGEQIVTNVLIPSGTNGSANYTFSIPANAVLGNIGTRVRITNVNTTISYGDSGSGEVEDHIATILPSLCIGNLVWHDYNNNGIKDATEPGLAGAQVQLFKSGPDNTVNTGDDVQVGATLTTGASGSYIYTTLGPANYYVKVTPPAGYIPSGTPATTDNDVDNNNDGSQPGGLGTPIYSPIVALTVNGESITDGDTDPTSNFTIDFGLWPGFTLGNEIWNDANDNATRDLGENGISGLAVELLNAATNAVVASTTTNGSGQYGFTVYTAGNYKVRVTPNATFPIASTTFTNLDNSVDNDNNGNQPGTRDTPATSPTFTLTAGAETQGTGNTENTIDFGFRACPTVSILPATVASGVWGIPYTAVQFTSTGHIGATSFSATGLPTGLSVSGAGVLSGTPMQVGTFVFVVSETDAKACVVSRSLSITILCPTLTMSSVPATFPTAVMLRPFSASFAVTGGQGPRTYTVSGGSLPPGLTLSAAGVLSGTPAASGTYTFTIQSVDALPCTVQQQFTLVVLPPLSLGNLVFLDLNGNGHYDSGEGVDGVTLQLFDSTQIVGVSTPLATTTTAGGGKYLFQGLLPGIYRVFVPAAMFASGAPLANTISIAEGLTGDDDVGENGINSDTPSITGISSNLITIQVGQAPTDLNGETGFDSASDNTYDAAVDLSVDFGFATPLGVGNLVFIDANLNGHYDSGEGVEGVTIELYRSTDTPGSAPPVNTTITDANGHYFFDYLPTGSYFIFVPPSQFNPGGPLVGKVSVTGVGTATGDDNLDENGIDDISPIVNGIRSTTFTLSNNTAPTVSNGETGYDSNEDSRDDNNYDLTIDLGFRAPDPNAVGVGNAVFMDSNGNNFFDTGEGIDGVTVRLYTAGANVATAQPVATTITSGGGTYFFANLTAGSYFVYLPGSNFASGGPLYSMRSLPGQGTDNGIDDDQDENGDDPASPPSSGVRSTDIALAPNTEPTDNTGEFGSLGYMDDVDDNNNDLTVDFGFYRPVGVGNLVFIDGNRNGLYNPGEGVDGVKVELYTESQSPGFDPPLATTTTSGGGYYLFSNLVPGYYIVHLPTTNFASTGALYGFTPLSGQGTDTGTDDDADENGSDTSQTFAEGVSSTVITLFSGAEPTDATTETGAGKTNDNAMDSDVDLTVDFGFYAGDPSSYSQWMAQNPLGGQNGPTLDPDGDGLTNLGEYVFALTPGSGVSTTAPFELKVNSTTGVTDAWARLLIATDDTIVTLQGLNDLSTSPGGWFDIATITPEITSTANGVKIVAWRNVEALSQFTGAKGFLRLKIDLDANHDFTPEATTTSDAWGFTRRTLPAQIVSYSNPFSKQAIFTGAITSVTGATLDVTAAAGGTSISAAMTGTIPYYIEVISGDHEGHRFEVNEASCTANSIVLETSHAMNTLTTIPATLEGDRIALRAHWTTAEWLPPAKFRATNNQSTADRILFYSGSSFATTWLFSNAGNPKWVNDASLADRGTKTMDPGEAVLVNPRSTSAPNFVNLGVVRANKFACPIKQGTRLMAGGWPMDQSATARGILYANGFTGSNNSTRSDRIQIWVGDTTPGSTTYESHYLLKTATLQQWVKIGDSSLTNENNLLLYKAFRGVYFNSISGKLDYVAPRAWTP